MATTFEDCFKMEVWQDLIFVASYTTISTTLFFRWKPDPYKVPGALAKASYKLKLSEQLFGALLILCTLANIAIRVSKGVPHWLTATSPATTLSFPMLTDRTLRYRFLKQMFAVGVMYHAYLLGPMGLALDEDFDSMRCRFSGGEIFGIFWREGLMGLCFTGSILVGWIPDMIAHKYFLGDGFKAFGSMVISLPVFGTIIVIAALYKKAAIAAALAAGGYVANLIYEELKEELWTGTERSVVLETEPNQYTWDGFMTLILVTKADSWMRRIKIMCDNGDDQFLTVGDAGGRTYDGGPDIVKWDFINIDLSKGDVCLMFEKDWIGWGWHEVKTVFINKENFDVFNKMTFKSVFPDVNAPQNRVARSVQMAPPKPGAGTKAPGTPKSKQPAAPKPATSKKDPAPAKPAAPKPAAAKKDPAPAKPAAPKPAAAKKDPAPAKPKAK
eukprot:gene4957-5761_t